MAYLGDMLVSNKLITQDQLNFALKRQQITKEKLGKILVKSGFIDDYTLSEFLIKKHNVLKYEKDFLTIPATLQKKYPLKFILESRVIPFKEENNTLLVGINDFNILTEIEVIGQKIGKKIVPYFFKDAMFEKIITELSNFPYGVKDYTFISFQSFSTGKLSENFTLSEFLKVINEFDKSINYLILLEGESPVVRKSRSIYDLIFKVFTKKDILNFIKEITDDAIRKKLIQENFVIIKKEMNNKYYNFTIVKNNNNFAIHIKHALTNVMDFENLGFKDDIKQYIARVPNGVTFFLAPLKHGKSSVFSSILSYYNKQKPFKIFSIDYKFEYDIFRNKSLITQIECKDQSEFSSKLKLALELEPDILFVSDIPDVQTLEIVLNMAESGVSVFASMDGSSVVGMFEKISITAGDAAGYYLNKLSDILSCIINMRLVPVKGVDRKILVYETIFNNFKLKKLVKEKNFNNIETQIKGTGDFVPIEKKMAELFLKGTIEYERGEAFCSDAELYKRYCNITS